MKLWIIAAFAWTSAAHATPVRDLAPTLGDAAPDQETFYEYLTPLVKQDADEASEADQARRARIAELKKEYETSKDTITRTGDLHELSALYQERSFRQRDLAGITYEKDYDRWFIGETLAVPQLKGDAAKEELLNRVNVLRDFVATYPTDPRRDEMNWQLASTMARLGNDHCEFYFKSIVDPGKTNEWGDKARLSRADYLMSVKKVDEAIALYSRSREKAADDYKAYATYRFGWAQLVKGLSASSVPRAEAIKKAEAAFQLVVVTLKEDQGTRFNLRAEAAKDLAWVWAMNGNEAEAKAFFTKHDLEELLPYFEEKLANEWLVQGKLAKAVAYYDDLMAKNPKDPKVPDMLLRLAQGYLVAGDVNGLGKEMAALDRITSKKDDPWYEEHEDDQALVTRAKKMRTLLPLTSGFKMYKAAEGEKDPKRKKDLMAASVKSLKEYVQRSPQDPQIATIRATLVTGLIGMEKYADALDQLDEIVKLGHRAEAYLSNAAFERLNILVKLDGEQKYPPVPEPAMAKSPLPLPDIKRRFASAAGDYLRIVPKPEIEPNLRFQIAMDLFTYGHYDESMGKLEALVNDFPRTDQAKTAIETMLSYHLKHDHWDELVRLSTSFLNNRNVKGKNLRDYIKQNMDYAKQQKR